MRKKVIVGLVLVLVFCLAGAFAASPVSAAYKQTHTRAAAHVRGKILLEVEGLGEAWYIEPVDGLRYYLGRPQDAFDIMRGLGLGATHENIQKIPSPVHRHGSLEFARRFSGRILIDVDRYGEAWYINPADLQGYYLGRPDDAFDIMRSTGLGARTDYIRNISPNVQITGIFYDGIWAREADEFVDIHNFGRMDVGMRDWNLKDEEGHTFVFPDVTLHRRENIRIYTGTGKYKFDYNWPIWNNNGDIAFLRASTGALVDSYNYY
jgi:hypothetical protein